MGTVCFHAGKEPNRLLCGLGGSGIVGFFITYNVCRWTSIHRPLETLNLEIAISCLCNW